MRFNLRQIEVFRAVMVTGSISGAARLLSVSQPAISRLLAYTEDRLGLTLFERVKGRVHPTPEARRLFSEVDQVHQGVLRVNELAQELRERGTGALHVVASPSVGQALVPEAIGRFRERFSDVRVELEILTIHDLVARVGGNRVDLGVSVLPVDEPTISCVPIMEGQLQVICPRDHPLAALSAVRPADLAPYPLIGYGPQTPYGLLVERALGAGMKPIRINTIVRFTPIACAMVQAGAGVAVVDEFVLRGATWPSIVSRPLEPPAPIRAHLLTSRLEPLSRMAQAFVAMMRELPPPRIPGEGDGRST
ncbi:LysR family transcriptional regulator [Microvirga brassicacearum]|uniref:LysR family transcriptional regulator n=1 Tax=Microvirga brassicacearum TaxID=2580413 RepID=A0A5N3PDC3_9HYPH|nr:LysR family transcriptional regulator [Microvirga brassicacearum]KAB0267693.1 LysR family transcriptional regulator [Microvirga brassicacearum]